MWQCPCRALMGVRKESSTQWAKSIEKGLRYNPAVESFNVARCGKRRIGGLGKGVGDGRQGVYNLEQEAPLTTTRANHPESRSMSESTPSAFLLELAE